MSGTQEVPNLLAHIKDLERRIKDLERSARLTNSTIQDGALKIRRADGTLLAYIGDFPGTTLTGIRVYNEDGILIVTLGEVSEGEYGLEVRDPETFEPFFLVRGDGWWRPWQMLPMGSPDNGQQTTGLSNTSFEERFLVDFFASAQELTMNYTLDVAGGDTVEVRFTIEEIGVGPETTIETQSKTSSGVYLFEQDIPGAVYGLGKNYRFRVKARRAAGAGTYDIGINTPLVNRPS